jgi:non-specific protein-tyrosine kinase
MELRQYLSIAWRWAWLAALSVIIAGTSSYFASRAATPLYQTKSSVMIGQLIANPNPSTGEFYVSQQLAYTYIQLVYREPVLNGTVKALGLKMDWRSISVNAALVPNTSLLEIKVVDVDPYRAKVLADEIARQLILQSPASNSQISADQAAFAQKQLESLKANIEAGQTDLDQLRKDLDAANSARQIQDLQTQIGLLQTKIAGWQNTYSQLLLSVKGGSANTLSIVEEASIPGAPFSPDTRTNVMVASAIGLALAMAGAFLIEYLDDTIKTPDDLTRMTNLPVVGTIARIEGKTYAEKLVAASNPRSPIVEAYRVLRTNLQFSFLDKPVHTLLLTSPGPGEGKSVTIANLGVVLAQTGRKVIIVDSDLRKPVQHRIFNLPNHHGLSDAILQSVSSAGLGDEPLQIVDAGSADVVAPPAAISDAVKSPRTSEDPSSVRMKELIDTLTMEAKQDALPSTAMVGSLAVRQPLSEFLQTTAIPNLRILTSGPIPPNPSEMMASERMQRLIELLKNEADLVLFDSPPTLLVSDAAILSGRVDGTILVNDAGSTRTTEARRAADELRKVHANLVGAVLNRMSRRGGGYYYYYRSYSIDNGEKVIRKKSKPWYKRLLPSNQKHSSSDMD